MTAAARRRRWRVLGGCCSAIALAVGLVVAIGVAGGAPHASANPTGASPQLYVTGNLGLFRYSLDSILAGGASPDSTPLRGLTGPVAVNVTAGSAVIGLGPKPTLVGDVNVGTGAESTTPTALSPDAIAVDPTNPATAYVLEGTGSRSEIDTVDLSTSPPGDQLLLAGPSPAFPVCCALTSLAISPDGQTLFVGEEDDGHAYIGIVPTSNPTFAFSWEWQNGKDGVDLESIADLVVAPNGKTLYATGPGFSTAGSEGEVFALSLPITNEAQNPVWSLPFTTANFEVGLTVPTCITVSPDGSVLDIGGNEGPTTESAVQNVSAGGSPSGFAQVPIFTNPNGSQGLTSIAFAPDGRNLVVSGIDGRGSSAASIYPVQASDLTVGPPTALPVRFSQAVPESLAITPDQAPAASLTGPPAEQVGHSATFDASGSSVAYGSVNTFAWNFGDGNTATTGSPTVSHAYGAPGNYQVSVTETDSAGTSITTGVAGVGGVDGPGQTPYRRADPSAQTSVAISVTTLPPPPTTTTTTTTTVHGHATTTTTTTTVPGHHVPGTPFLILNPGLGPPGTIVTVTGHGFRANTAVTIAWSVSTGSIVVTADAHGNLPPKQLLILTPDVLGPRFAEASSTPRATAPFLVVPSDSEPGGDNAGLLFRSEGP